MADPPAPLCRKHPGLLLATVFSVLDLLSETEPPCGNLGCSSLLVPSWGRCRTLVQQPEAFPRGHPQLWPHSLWLFSVPSCGRGKTQQQLCLDRFHRPERSIAGSVAFAGATPKG